MSQASSPATTATTVGAPALLHPLPSYLQADKLGPGAITCSRSTA